MRPTLDDGSSSDSCNSSSSGSGSDDDAVTSGDSTCSAQEQAHHFNGNDGSTNSDPSCALPSPNPSELKQAAATPHQWFWSAFISVQRLPGVCFHLAFPRALKPQTFKHSRMHAFTQPYVSTSTAVAVRKFPKCAFPHLNTAGCSSTHF